MQRVAIISGVVIVLGLALVSYAGPTSEVLGSAAFGWLFYPARVFPKVTVAWAGVATGLVCLALFTIGWHDPRNSAYFKAVIPNYLNPEIGAIRNPEGYGLSHYAGNIHILNRDRASRRVGPEDTSTTILIGEVAEGFKPWGDPTNLRDPGLGVNKVPGGFGGASGSGANFLFMDGSVRFLRNTTSREVLRRLGATGIEGLIKLIGKTS